MKKLVVAVVASLTLLSCAKKASADDISKINGYWEIESVIMPDGSEKDYTVNPTIDYFEVKGKEGFRKKVMPQFDGTYKVNDGSEKISISEKDNKVYMDYTTTYAKWQEELLELTDEELVVKNQHGIEYHYKKPEPFTVK
ncbi:hypothetical protein GR160_11330 [Flavobacterium sp. Sd200]|uniref:lipocalin family protein n=1 Tax=Flavobacterium sp. Sd200 TaxID=2692211 RepID=UPI001371A182|nr:lipocalin family protein [Flavobacterium sp. Sd200]MXN91818.1 hypothetical protein [Flavobacterium sp. Sd200]